MVHELVVEIRKLRRQLQRSQEREESAEAERDRISERAQREARNRADEVRRLQDEADYRSYERDTLMKDLEKARVYGDEWAEQRTLRKLKDL